jgi:hypothetical protein
MYLKLSSIALAFLLCGTTQVEAQDAADNAIATQTKRFNAAYDQYFKECVALDQDELDRYRVLGRLPSDCRKARDDYELQADILIRLIHGNQPDAELRVAE